MSRGFRWTLGLVLLASAIGGLVLLWPTETKRVTRMVERFAADASFIYACRATNLWTRAANVGGW